jgi:hypothetical protein
MGNKLKDALTSHVRERSQWGIAALLAAIGVNIVISFQAKFDIGGIRAERNNSFVIGPDGLAQKARRVSDLTRPAEQLNRFAWEFTKTCYTWNGRFDEKPDKGVRIYGRQVPTVFANCMAALDPFYQQEYVQGFYDAYAKHPLLKDTISLSAFLGNRTGTAREAQIWPTTLPECTKDDKSVACISSPSPGVYNVPIASKRYFVANGAPYATPENFNLLYTFKAVSPYRAPWTKDETEFGNLLNRWHEQGLMITRISKLPDTLY